MAEIDDVLPKYLRISRYLRDRIECGELAPGAEVPSERELAARWKVARPTAAKALNVLRRQGVVESRRGSGTYVADRAALMREHEPRYRTSFAANESVSALETAVVAGPRVVTDALGLSRDSAVIMRKRLVANDSGPELVTSWFPGRFAESAVRLLDTERLPGGTLGYLESTLGRGAVMVRERVSARLPTAAERRHLTLPRPAAVLVRHRSIHDADGVAIEFDEVIHPPGHWVLQHEYPTSSTVIFRR
ncbi:GntR family transcriptional regulator [Nocardia sp. NPDC049190]|uniref:GntR family transcriptional regulator n=1 Tax=Nocardia sp. NPDC049190 TaxID=3155650 RepID=UPI0034051AF9